jgi:hypothetical protein
MIPTQHPSLGSAVDYYYPDAEENQQMKNEE